MNKINFFFFISFLLFSQFSQAQNDQYPLGISIKTIYLDFDRNEIANGAETKLDRFAGLEFALHKSLIHWLDLVLPIRLGETSYELLNGERESVSLLGLNAMLHAKLNEEAKFTPYLLGGLGVVFSFNEEKISPEAALGLGIDYDIDPLFSLNFETSYRLALSQNEPPFDHLQWSAGILILLNGDGESPTKLISMMDKDGDGVEDSQDVCPNVAGLKKFSGCPDTDRDGVSDEKDDCPGVAGLLAFNGCPDSDSDGIVDFEDACPNQAGTKARNGCPAGDSDGDGVDDDKDACPNNYGLPRYNGCPDSDGDGVIDLDDECPNKVGLARYNGCPDTDGDGLIDSKDRCPAAAGSLSNNGCPEMAAEDKAILTRAITDVRFETGSEDLKVSSYGILDQIVSLMRKYPSYNLVINGHTDSVGELDNNQALSEDRARTCFTYLLNKGVEGYRMSHAGFGETQPISSNKTTEGKARNRRVTFE